MNVNVYVNIDADVYDYVHVNASAPCAERFGGTRTERRSVRRRRKHHKDFL